MHFELASKVAVVTGAASGIGAEIVRVFLEAGAGVIAVDRCDPPVAAGLADRFSDRLRGVTGDVAAEVTAAAFTRAALDGFSRLDILVNNAAVSVVKPIHEHTPEEWDRVMDVNVKSIFWAVRHVVPVMKRQRGGVILNTGSISGVVGLPGQGAYGPSKGAVVQLTRQMAVEYAADNIRVNVVCPGTVLTPLVRQSAADSGEPEAFMQRLRDAHPVGRVAEPAEIAPLFLFLASDQARFITGAVLMIDGGYTAR
jgi:NAD(P)-dependent dehydrogenase (short-subunit alcohol dehydrogenase family)